MITVTRNTETYRRTVNGAWRAGAPQKEVYEVGGEQEATAIVRSLGMSSSVVLTWPDGHSEFWCRDFSLGIEGPAESRLTKGAAKAGTRFWPQAGDWNHE